MGIMKLKRSVEDRSHIVGCSSLGMYMGVSTYGTLHDAWAEYTGKQKEFTPEQQERLDMGHALEDFIAREAGKKYRVRLQKSNYAYADTDHPFIICHPDRLLVKEIDGKRIAVEIKSSSAYDSRWGKPETDEVPMDYLCQTQGYFICGVPCDEVWLIRFSNNQITRYIIRPDQELMDAIVKKVGEVVEKFDSGWEPGPSTYEEAQKIFTDVVEDPIEADKDALLIVQKLSSVREQIKDLQTEEDTLKAALVASMKGHATLTLSGSPIVTYTSVTQNRFDAKKFEKDHPDLYGKYIRTTSFNKLSIK